MRTVRVPGDKSLTHRALIFAALAEGASRVGRPLVSADTAATAAALRALGGDIPDSAAGDELIIGGRGLRGLRAPAAALDCGNSGTTARLLTGILAACHFTAELTGDASLRSRPMRRVTAPLTRMGARFEELGAPDRLPIRVHGGTLRPLHYDSPHASAQVKSALLLAGLVAGVPVTVREPAASRDHTERMLRELGVDLHSEVSDDGTCTVRLEPAARLAPFAFDVPGDFSSAAFILAFAAMRAPKPIRVTGVGLNPGRTGFLDVLRRMGAAPQLENQGTNCGEPIGDIVMARADLVATDIAGSEIPALIDEIPVIAMLAARARGTTTVRGAGELRVKESDRIAAVVNNLRAIGVRAEELDDGMVIEGTDAPLAGMVATLHDHRIAMAFGLLAAEPGARIGIDDPAIVGVSFPDFWTTLDALQAV